MKIQTAMILAGGLGTRFKEYTQDIPKPMIEANGTPLLIHIIRIYLNFNIKNFVILAGYKKNIIESYFEGKYKKLSEVDHIYEFENSSTVTILETGDETMTGGRIKKGFDYLNEREAFLTYGDGIANIDIDTQVKEHYKYKPLATLTAVRPPARFGSLKIMDNKVTQFNEKNHQSDDGWINGGFFILNSEVVNFIENTSEAFEKGPLEKISEIGKLNAYKHQGLFRPVDTIRELEILETELTNNDFGFRLR